MPTGVVVSFVSIFFYPAPTPIDGVLWQALFWKYARQSHRLQVVRWNVLAAPFRWRCPAVINVKMK